MSLVDTPQTQRAKLKEAKPLYRAYLLLGRSESESEDVRVAAARMEEWYSSLPYYLRADLAATSWTKSCSRKAEHIRKGDVISWPEEMAGTVVSVVRAEVEPCIVIYTERSMNDPRESRVIENRGAFDSWKMLSVESRRA